MTQCRSVTLAFFRELRAAGLKSQDVATISFSIGENELRHLNVKEMIGNFAGWNYFQSIDTKENNALVEKLKENFGPQRVITYPMEAGYWGVMLWAAAVRDTAHLQNSPDRED